MLVAVVVAEVKDVLENAPARPVVDAFLLLTPWHTASGEGRGVNDLCG